MIQHPIPQNVTGYQFRLIGDMTIKQFLMLCIGICSAIFFYYTNLFSLLKWFFVIMSSILGFALAFLPLEERPLDQWIINYIKAIYKPTRFIWAKAPQTPEYFNFIQDSRTIIPSDEQEVSRQAAVRREQGLKSFLVTLPQDILNQDTFEQDYINSINSLFVSDPIPYSSQDIAATFNITNISDSTAAPTNSTTPSNASFDDSDNESSRPKSHLIDNTVPSGVINLSPVHIEKEEKDESETLITDHQTQTTSSFYSTTIATETNSRPVVTATTTPDLPFPSTPTTPNTIVGMVIDPSGKIVDNAIVEVIDESGLPARATKTNQLGQFFSTTPLKRGTYHITVEKPGLTFDTIELTLVGSIVPPIKVQAKT